MFNARGELLVGGGKVEYKWASATNVVRTTLARHGGTIVTGDVFAANDPHNGGGNHPAGHRDLPAGVRRRRAGRRGSRRRPT